MRIVFVALSVACCAACVIASHSMLPRIYPGLRAERDAQNVPITPAVAPSGVPMKLGSHVNELERAPSARATTFFVWK